MRDKNIWIFNAGNAFSGNPKWLFEYVVNYHPEIECHWFCYERELVKHMRELGFNACLFDSAQGKLIGSKAGVYVVNQFKEVFQDYLEGIAILNLWHGVGCKTVERGVTSGFLHERIVKKHIEHRRIYDTSQLFLVTSPLMEKHFIGQCGLDEFNLVRAGYPCCTYPGTVTTFDHDFLAQKGLPQDTTVVAFVPTYRDNEPTGFFSRALPDFERLINTLEEQNMLLIMKMHPQMEKDPQYLDLKRQFADSPRILFWDNTHDIYEVFDRIDVGIIDYSSMFYDMLAGGVRKFIRYFFDLDEGHAVRDFVFDVREMTCGIEALDFDGLIDALGHLETQDDADVERINELFWAYATPDSCETIFQRAMAFEPDLDRKTPTLWSYDIFDTLISRTTLIPRGPIYYVQQKICQSGMGFPDYLMRSYEEARRCCEWNCREYKVKTVFRRDDDFTEISFDDIFVRMADVYGVTDEQIEALKRWELEAELLSTIPIPENIAELKGHLAAGEDVVLISDMYLPKEFIQKLLAKADPALVDVPLYLSSDVGYQKTKLTLFLSVFHSLDYRYGKWVHKGDSLYADVERPAELGITTVHYDARGELGEHALELTDVLPTYDAQQVGRLISRFETDASQPIEARFAYCYASLFFVPYVYWALDDCLERGVDSVYFISRDGYHLKRIADVIIEERKLPLKTHYLYGSRKAWRIPSQVTRIDEDFFSDHGNFAGLLDFDSLLVAGAIDEESFLKMFPELTYLHENRQFDAEECAAIIDVMANSSAFREHILNVAKERRPLILDYLRQEIDFSERFAFVEYWGRGYTQTCLSSLLHEIDPAVEGTTFYYARSIYPSEGKDIRRNLTASTVSLIFVESIFSNIPYRTVSEFQREGDRIEPVIVGHEYNERVFGALETYLPQFARDFARLNLTEPKTTMLEMFNFGIGHFRFCSTQEVYLECIAPLKDSVSIYEAPVEYAPAWTMSDALKRVRGIELRTRNRDMSLARSRGIMKFGFSLFTIAKLAKGYLTGEDAD